MFESEALALQLDMIQGDRQTETWTTTLKTHHNKKILSDLSAWQMPDEAFSTDV